MPKKVRTVTIALMLGAAMGCDPKSLTTPSPVTEVPVNPSGVVRSTPGPDAPLGDPQFPSPRPIPSRAGELKGRILGPRSALVTQHASSVTSAPTTGLLATPATTTTSYQLANTSTDIEPKGQVKVVLTDANGTPVSDEITTDADGHYSFKGFLSASPILFVKATYEDNKRKISLMGASTFPNRGEVADITVTPASSMVAKKAIEMVRLGAADGQALQPAMLQKMATTVADYMSPKALVAAGLLPDGKVAAAFDLMLNGSAPLKSQLTTIATDAGVVKFLNKTPAATTTIQGTIHDEEAKPLVGQLQVTIKSLSPDSHPYEETVTTSTGVFSATKAPTEVQLEITASGEGFTSRSRVVVLPPMGQSRVDFGGTGEEDPEAMPYFLSGRPEIVKTEPVDETEATTTNPLVYKLHLSEALDEANRNVFAASLFVIPSNDAADFNPNDAVKAQNLVESAVSDVSLSVQTLPYWIGPDTKFLGDATIKPTVTWDDTGKIATLTFNAPLLANTDADALYNVALFNTGVDIKDKDGKRLGTDKTGSAVNKPAQFGIWCGTFKDSFFTLASTDNTADKRWLATHHVASAFKVAKDTAKPLLSSATAIKTSEYTRFELAFSEPMAAALLGQFTLAPITNFPTSSINFALANFTFAVATNVTAISDVELDGSVSKVLAASSAVFADPANYNQEFYFTVSDASQAMLSIDPARPHVVRLDLRSENQTPFAFDSSLKYFKVRIGNNVASANKAAIADPAGNYVTDAESNFTVKTGTL